MSRAALAVRAVLLACSSHAAAEVAPVPAVMESIHIAPGQAAEHVSNVNGSIQVGPRVHAAKTINTVNGSIAVDAGTDVRESVRTVNGAMTVTGARVGGEASTVNGAIRLHAAHVEGEITGVNGTIDIGADSRVEHGLHATQHGRLVQLLLPAHPAPHRDRPGSGPVRYAPLRAGGYSLRE